MGCLHAAGHCALGVFFFFFLALDPEGWRRGKDAPCSHQELAEKRVK